MESTREEGMILSSCSRDSHNGRQWGMYVRHKHKKHRQQRTRKPLFENTIYQMPAHSLVLFSTWKCVVSLMSRRLKKSSRHHHWTDPCVLVIPFSEEMKDQQLQRMRLTIALNDKKDDILLEKTDYCPPTLVSSDQKDSNDKVLFLITRSSILTTDKKEDPFSLSARKWSVNIPVESFRDYRQVSRESNDWSRRR